MSDIFGIAIEDSTPNDDGTHTARVIVDNTPPVVKAARKVLEAFDKAAAGWPDAANVYAENCWEDFVESGAMEELRKVVDP